jgi:hypothetical protein
MNQSTIVFFFLFAAYVVFITQRGELPAYLNLLFGAAPAKSTTAAPTTPLAGN